MKCVQKSVCAGFVVVLALSVLGCQEKAKTEQAAPEKDLLKQVETDVAKAPAKSAEKAIPADAPKIKVVNSSYDFGVLPPDSKDNKGKFEFINEGKGVLKIDHVQSTCGCTVPELSKKEYQPGESGTLTFTFHAPAYAGNVTKHLYIVSNDPANPRAELTLMAKVEVKVIADPNRVELILNKENAGMPSIKVKSVDNQPFAITSITSSNQIVSCGFDPNTKQVEHILTPKVDVTKLTDFNTGTIQISVDHPSAKQVIVTYNALPMYELRPARLVLQNVNPQEVIKRQVGVVNNYGQPFEIESMTSKSGMIKVVNQIKDGNNINLELEVTPPKQDGAARRYISDELIIKIAGGPVLTVRCSGWYKL